MAGSSVFLIFIHTERTVLSSLELLPFHVFAALAHAHVNVKMIDQGSSELNIIIGVENRDFETALKAIYDIFVLTQI